MGCNKNGLKTIQSFRFCFPSMFFLFSVDMQMIIKNALEFENVLT